MTLLRYTSFACFSRGLLITAGFAVLALHVSTPVQAQEPAQTDAADGKAFAYEVISVKPYKPDNGSGVTMWWRTTKVGFSAAGLTLQALVMGAYGLVTTEQIEGLPSWGDSAQFTIDAKMDEDVAAAFEKLAQKDRDKQRMLMQQSMLEDRFQLKAHHEMRERPIYELVVAKSGSKLKNASKDAKGGWSWGETKFTGDSVEIVGLANALSSVLGRTIVDKTGLTGHYEISLTYAPIDEDGPGHDSADAGPSIFTALEEQLGLKLVAAKGPVDTIVVDHVEKPSEN